MTAKIALFIPTFNVEAHVGNVLRAIPESALEKIGRVYVIDNGSTDGTISEIQKFKETSKDSEKFQLFKNQENYFLGGSTIIALNKAIAEGFDYLICMHSDGQADPKTLLELIENSRNDNDFVFGSRFLPSSQVEDYSKTRQLGNLAFVRLQQLLIKKKVYDIGAFISFNLKTIKDYPYYQLPWDMGYQPLLVMYICRRKDIKFVEIPMSWGKVEHSNVNVITYGLTHLWRLFRFAIGRVPLTNKNKEDFVTVEISS